MAEVRTKEMENGHAQEGDDDAAAKEVTSKEKEKKEEEVQEEAAGDGTSSSSEDGMKKLQEELRKLRLELDDARSATAVAECVKESMLELERQKTSLEEEMATMQQLLNESHDDASAARTDYEHQLAKAKAVISQLEVENQELKINMKVGGQGAGGGGGGGGAGDSVLDRDTILGGAAVISDATKSFARRMKSNLLQTAVMPGGDKGQQQQQQQQPSLGGGARAPSPQQQQAGNLEDLSVRRAHEESELLKAIVVPMEEQIAALKDKLRETDALLREHEEKQGRTILAVDGLSKWLEGRPLEEAMGELLEKSKSEEVGGEDKSRNQAQEAAYIALMSARYSLLVGELASTRKENKELVDFLTRERTTIRRLKQETVVASSDMMRVQREHLAEVTRLHGLLTEEQKAQLLSRQNSAEMKEQSPGPEAEPPRGAEMTTSAATLSPAKSPVDSISSHSSSDSCQSKGHSKGAESEDEGITRIVSAVEWDSMQRELDKVRALLGVGAGDSVVGSDQYRALQAELIELKKQKAMLNKNVEKLKEEARTEDGFRRQLEERWNERAEQHRSETEGLSRQVQDLESVLEQVRLSYTANYAGCRKDQQRLRENREKIVRELKRLQEEVDVLTGKHSAKAAEMQNEPINLPEKVEDMQLLLLRLREDTITAKVTQERAEEKAKAELAFLKTQLRGEEESRASVEDQYTTEIESLKSEMAKNRGCQRELQLEQQRRREAEGREEEVRKAMAAASRTAEAAEAEKRESEARMAEMKSRLTNLQQELDNSVAVQTDFVRLSQSLQVELEKIRQSEKEVRWQHEDDVDECQGCKVALAGPGGVRRSPAAAAAAAAAAGSPHARNRSKHHCRHCGRIFCSDCLSKSVGSGPRRRPAKVCDVCHTLLVQNSAPYFSTEAPQAN